MVYELLCEYRDKHPLHCRPEVILFYRDGVSDSQFTAVREQEFELLRQVNNMQGCAVYCITANEHHCIVLPSVCVDWCSTT